MAATGSEEAVTGVEVGEDFRGSCSLCMEPYRGRKPKILPCFHTFCLPCLSALAESAGAEKPEQDEKKKDGVEGQPKSGDVDDAEGREKDAAGGSEGGGSDVNRCHGDGTMGAVFLCPTCRAPVTVPEGGVAALQTNFYIATETRETTTQPYLCDLCEEGDAKEATHACDKCRQRMCKACRRLHDKFFDPREHPVRALNIHEAAPKKAETRKWCTLHRDQELCFHCKDCDVSICLHCKLTLHQPHVTEDMAAAILRGKEELMKLVATAKEQIEAVEKSLIRLSRDSKELSRQRQEVTEELGARYDEVLRWVNRSRDELLETIAATADAAATGLKAEEKSARVTMETLSDLVSRAARVASNNPEVLLLKNELRAALLGEDGFDHYQILGNREEQKRFLQVNSDTTAFDLEVVRSYIGELSRGEGDVPCSSLWKQLQDMKDNIVAQEERLRQQMSDHSAALEAKQKTAEEKLGQQMSDQSTALEVKQKTAEEQLRRQNADCKTEVESMMKTIESRMGTTVAFHAWHSTNTLYVAASETLTLNHAATNIGNAYDTQTGIFTVPIDGLYDFQATIMSNVNIAVSSYVGLYVDNEMMARGLSDSSHGYWDQSTIRAVVHVKKGQKVYLQNVSSAATYYSSISEPDTTFSGFLINAD